MPENKIQNKFQHSDSVNVAFIQARWFADIVDECRKSFISTTSKLSHGKFNVDIYDVPGAFEAHLLAKKIAKTGRYDAVVIAALVVDGGIYRHDFVASSVLSGLMSVQIETEIPMFSAVLTPHQYHSNDEHHHFFKDHFIKKGIEAAEACYSTICTHQALKISA